MKLGSAEFVGIGLVGAIWLVVLARQVSALRLCLGGLVTVSCFWLPFGQWEAGPLTLTIDRFYCIALLALAALKRLLATESPVRLDRGEWLLGALLLFCGAGVVLSPSPAAPSQEIPPWYRFTTALALPTLVYALLRYRRAAAQDARHITTFFFLFGVYLAVTAIAERHGFEALVFPSYILKPRTLYVGRAVGPFLSAPHLGTWLTIAFVAAVLKLERGGGLGKFAVLVTLPVFAYAQYLTQTRSAWLGFAAAGAYVIVSARWGMPKALLRWGMLGAGVLLTAVFGQRFLNPERAEGEVVVAYSWDQRLALADNALAMFLRHPVFGWGFGQFEQAAPQVAGERVLGFASAEAAEGIASHNVLLRFLVETGLVGTVIFLGVLWHWFIRARSVLRAGDSATGERPLALLFVGTLIAYGSEAMLHDVTHILQPNVLLFFLAGCLPVRRHHRVIADVAQ